MSFFDRFDPEHAVFKQDMVEIRARSAEIAADTQAMQANLKEKLQENLAVGRQLIEKLGHGG